ncbi:MAG: 4Fe-4S dicluster domain-containing protein [bacterium]|nr:4Fe-4S dicluster domain-containing protein [bacterium]
MKMIPIINTKKCTLCGKCIDICPKDHLVKEKIKEKDQVSVTVDECMLCSHCHSVCAFDAISFDETALKKIYFTSFKYTAKSIPAGKIDPEFLVNAIRSRRSVRKYTNQPIPNEIISDLLEFAVTAPSGSNEQEWEFTVLNGREKVWDLAQEIKKFFIKINAIAKNVFTRYLSVLVAGKTLITYYKERLESVEQGLREAEAGKDILFHGAPAVIICHSPMGRSTPVEDGQYATYNIALLAHALGLGTCYIGYASESINRVPKIKELLGIPKNNRVHAVLTLGYPNMTFSKLALRKNYSVYMK